MFLQAISLRTSDSERQDISHSPHGVEQTVFGDEMESDNILEELYFRLMILHLFRGDGLTRHELSHRTKVYLLSWSHMALERKSCST